MTKLGEKWEIVKESGLFFELDSSKAEAFIVYLWGGWDTLLIGDEWKDMLCFDAGKLAKLLNGDELVFLFV